MFVPVAPGVLLILVGLIAVTLAPGGALQLKLLIAVLFLAAYFGAQLLFIPLRQT